MIPSSPRWLASSRTGFCRRRKFSSTSCITRAVIASSHRNSVIPRWLIVDRVRRKFAIIELSVPAEENINVRHDKKVAKYQPLQRNVIETLGSGWSVELIAVEIGACGLQRTSLSAGFNVLQRLGILAGYERQDLKQLSDRLSFIALRCSYAIWATRKAVEWPDDAPLAF